MSRTMYRITANCHAAGSGVVVLKHFRYRALN